MSLITINPQYPDVYFELVLVEAKRGEPGPALQIERIEAKLEGGVYTYRGGFKTNANTLMVSMARNSTGENLSRAMACLEKDIPAATEKMRADILKEARHRAEYYQKMVAHFELEVVPTNERYYC